MKISQTDMRYGLNQGFERLPSNISNIKKQQNIPGMEKQQGIPGMEKQQGIPGIKKQQNIPGMEKQQGIPGIKKQQSIPGVEDQLPPALQKLKAKQECQTCKNRKYVDGSNEGNVSFKTPGHIAPQSSAAMVRAHENQHVTNAVREGSKPGNELVSVSVSLKTAICPECGRTYVSGGTTRTVLRYGNTAFEQNRKSADYAKYAGINFDMKG